MSDQAQREAKLKRDFGMSPEGRVALTAHNEKQNDWYGFCKHCGKKRYGTLAELRGPCECKK